MNTLRNVEGLAAECARVVKPNGVVIVAVPAIISSVMLEADIGTGFTFTNPERIARKAAPFLRKH